jgi:hypothetical protein
MLLAFLTGCSHFDKTNEGGDETNNNEPGNGGNEAGDVETDNSNNQNNEENQKPEGEGTPLDKDSDVIESIIYHMNLSDIEYIGYNLCEKIHLVENHGAQPLEISFDAFSFYYACAYDNVTDIMYVTEERLKQCNWYKFDDAAEIPEYYNGEKCVAVFQINKTASVVNLLQNDVVPQIEHFSSYETKFEQGYNVNPPVVFNETIIYLYGIYANEVEKKPIFYYTTTALYHAYATIRYVEYYGEKYHHIATRHVYPGYDDSIKDLELLLNIYYDDFADVIEYEKFSADNGHQKTFYSCIKIEDIIRVMKEKQAT